MKLTKRSFNAALDLFAERGIEATSMDSIAQASGVSKATIYNHWADKEALLLEVMLMVNGLDREPEDVDTGDLQRDLTTVLTRKPPDKFDAARNRMTPSLIAYSAIHPEFGKAWRHRVMEPPASASSAFYAVASPAASCPAILISKPPWHCCLAPCSTRTSSTRSSTRTLLTSVQ